MRQLTLAIMITGMLIFAGNVKAAENSSGVVKAMLNNLEITFDAESGSILGLYYPGPGQMLQTDPTQATIIDMAYPIEGFEPLRLASRFSKNAKIAVTANRVTVQWDKLGASRSSMEQSGNVSAIITFDALPDGKSIVMACEIANKSDIAVRQVIFPDFSGLLPFAGKETTIFKTGGFGRTPFSELGMNEKRLSQPFCMNLGYGAEEFAPGRIIYDTSAMWMRWMDFGGLQGGLSIFPKQWGWDTFIPIRLHHFEDQEKLRMLYVNDIDIQPGGAWKSCEFVLTPHKSGWAKGIEPYGQWVKQHVKRKYPLPKHIREGLGVRTIFMSMGFSKDPYDAAWKFSDLPQIAKESKEHGLDELCMWSWCIGFTLPLPQPQPNVGTEEELVQAVKDCKKIGVNVTPFISVLQAGKPTAAKYGLTVPQTEGWAQHPDTIPRFRPKYSTLYRCAQVDMGNPLWQKEVLESTKRLVDIGVSSLAWDQFWETPDGQIFTLASKIRDTAKTADPESVFAGEAVFNAELDSEYLDYTWDWFGYADCQEFKDLSPTPSAFNNLLCFGNIDCQAFTSIFPAPRINCVVSDSPVVAKLCFLDNRYLTVMPRKVGSVNGSDWIVNHQPLSQALKTCAALRKQFLPYFTDGRFIGNCILTRSSKEFHVSAYVLPESVLVFVMNISDGKAKMPLECDLSNWLPSGTGKYQVKQYNSDGKLIRKKVFDNYKWKSKSSTLQSQDIEIFEFLAQ